MTAALDKVKTFRKFREDNDHEGETWYHWLQVDGNEAELNKLGAFLGDGEEYRLEDAVLDEALVDVLVEHGGGGYMRTHNKVVGVFTCPARSEDEDEYSWLDDLFYKGGIRRHFKRAAE